MDEDSRVIDKGWDSLPEYSDKSGSADDDVTVSISTTPGEWLVNTVDSVVVPMSMADVVDALRVRKLTDRSLVWRAGMPEWAPIDKIPSLKLAARLPSVAPSAPPPPSTTAGAVPRPSSAPGRPASKTPPPRPSAPPAAQQAAAPGLSRRSTLPFGLPAPNPSSRPAQPKPSEPKLAALAEARSGNSEPGVLAVYDRPAATISFDLSPAEPVRAPPPVPVAPPQTLAPTTTDTRSVPRSAPPPAFNDLSVVAASQFRAVQRSSKRWVLVSSLASAAAASALTLWLAGGLRLPGAGAPKAAQAAAPVAAPPVAAQPAAPAAVPEKAEPAADAVAAAEAVAPKSEPKPAAPAAAMPAAVTASKLAPRKPRAVSQAPAKLAESGHGSLRDPSAEPNPYDVKLEDDAPAASKPATRPLTLVEAVKEAEAQTATGSTSPGF